MNGVVLALSRGDTAAVSALVHVQFGYGGFADAFGGDYGARLRLVSLPACVLSTPTLRECQAQTDLRSTNAVAAATVSADVAVAPDATAASGASAAAPDGAATVTGAQPTVLALMADASSSAGTYTATSLSSAYAWSAGRQGGDFGFTYPLKVPASLGGPAPEVKLQYSSGGIDARTLSTNGQASWLGEGWDYQPGYIERSYRSCSNDGVPGYGDLCWYDNNATMVFNGQSTALVYDNGSHVWHSVSDSGLRVDQLFGSAGGRGDNGSYNREYWRVTTQDGIQYFFGVNRRYAGDGTQTQGAQTVPVFGNNPGEPCYNANFFYAACWQGYRWNLDYVVDPRGNSMSYFYVKDAQAYGAQQNRLTVLYDRDARLDHIDYGMRAGSEYSQTPPVQVWFTPSERCTGSCGSHADYPDTPWDQYCAPGSGSCPSVISPVFWQTFKVQNVYTRVWNPATSTFRKVDQWDMAYSFPSTGDNISPAGDDTSPNLFLTDVTHTGYAADGSTTLAEPATHFGGTGMFNRVDWGNDVGVPPLTHYRITAVSNGLGGQTLVSYNPTTCTRAGSSGYNPDQNPNLCFPQYFSLDANHSGFGWFHKYTVQSVTAKDLVGGSPDEVWSYSYSTAGSSTNVLWHHDHALTSPIAQRSWSEWRGFSTVTVTHGASGGPQSKTTSLYYRGMDGDRTDDGWFTRRVGISDSQTADPGITGPMSGMASKCVDDDHGGTANGTHIQLYWCNATNAQQWTYTTSSTLTVMGKCMAVSGNGTGNGTPIILWDCDGSAGQVWQKQGNSWRNPNSGRCLDLPNGNTNDGNQLQIWDCNGAAPQNWTHYLGDFDNLAGRLREESTLDGSTVLTSTIHQPTMGRTASQSMADGSWLFADMANETTTSTRTWIAATSTWRWTNNQTSYDTYGNITDVQNLGDSGTSTDDTCTHVDYARDTSKWLIAFPSQSVVTDCATPVGDGDYLGGSQAFYDGSTTNGTAPTQGLVTRTNALATVSGGTRTWKQTARTGYDTNGRPTSSWDALDRQTTTSYAPASDAPVTQTVVTNPAGFTVTTTSEPGHGVPTLVVDPNAKTTNIQYDPLGRLTKVWQNNRPTTATPDTQYTYTTPGNAPSSVQTQKLNPTGGQVSTYQIYDGQLRSRQTQAPSDVDNGGRVISDMTYDSRGMTVKASTFWNSTAPANTLLSFADKDVPSQHRYTYDNLARPTVDALWKGDGTTSSQLYQTTTAYDGDRTTTTPPAGGTATRTLTNARGKFIELDQYLGSAPSGAFQATTYGYDRLGEQTRLTDPAGNQWTTSYDLRGRVTSKTDPDTGTTTSSYDDAGQRLSSLDARNITLSYVYDNLGRRTQEWQGAVGTGTKLADWTYDTLAKGQLTSSNRYASGGTYTVATTGFDDAYRPLGTSVTVPASDGFSPNSWTTSQTYNVDGSPASTTLPAAGGLGAETLTYGYDATGRPLTMTGSNSYVNATWYYPWGPAEQLDLGAGGAQHMSTFYDETTGRLSGVWTANGTGDPSTWTTQLDTFYLYDQVGNVIDKWTTEANGTVYAECFRYDGLRQMKEAWSIPDTITGDCTPGPSQAVIGGNDPYWHSFSYDNVGNRTGQTVHSTSGDTTYTYTYPSAGQPQPHTVSNVTATGLTSGTSSYGYDSAGNTTTRNVMAKPGQTLTWDAEGHLATVTASGATTSYIYDANGNRLASKDSTGETVYLGHSEIRRTASTGTITCTRFYSYADRQIATRTNQGTLSWQALDNHDTTELSIDATNLATTRLYTDPFGNPRDTTPWPSSKGFVSGTTDPTGLTHLGAREYDPGIGRFISADPILDFSSPQQVNGYSYANNNPTTSSDPSGLRLKEEKTGGDYEQHYTVGGVSVTKTYDPHNGNVHVTVAGIPVATYHVRQPSERKGPAVSTVSAVVQDANVFAQKVAHGYEVNKGKDPRMRLLLALNEACTETAEAGCDPQFTASIRTATDKKMAWLRDGCDDRCFLAREQAGAALTAGFMIAAYNLSQYRGMTKNDIRPDLQEANMALDQLGGCSFSGNTRVLMADGRTKPISDVEVGDLVQAVDPEHSQNRTSQSVTNLHLNRDTYLADITVVADGHSAILHTTQNHPFWDHTLGHWVPARELQPGHQLGTPDGSLVAVVAVRSFITAQYMYNLTIADVHTYYVVAGNASVLVHNAPCRTFGFSNAPKVPGTYTITMKDGRVYVGASASDVHARIHAAFTDKDAAVYQAGYTPADVDSISVNDMSGWSWDVIRGQEQSVIDQYGGIGGGTLLNRRNEVP